MNTDVFEGDPDCLVVLDCQRAPAPHRNAEWPWSWNNDIRFIRDQGSHDQSVDALSVSTPIEFPEAVATGLAQSMATAFADAVATGLVDAMANGLVDATAELPDSTA